MAAGDIVFNEGENQYFIVELDAGVGLNSTVDINSSTNTTQDALIEELTPPSGATVYVPIPAPRRMF